jgi:hypothetical protein
MRPILMQTLRLLGASLPGKGLRDPETAPCIPFERGQEPGSPTWPDPAQFDDALFEGEVKMPRPVQILAVTLVSLAVCAAAGAHRDKHDREDGHDRGRDHDRIEGSGDRVKQTRDVKDFDEIQVDCAFDVEITVGPRFALELTYDDNLIDLIETDVRGGTLVLDCDGEHDVDRSCKARIEMPSLAGITINGAAQVHVQGMTGESFEYDLHGAGDLEIQGSVGRIEVHLLGAGSVDARDLIAEEADVQLSGTGSVRVHANERFRGQVSGCGSIDYYGDPPQARENVSGIGSITRH